jgi:hypothetical protein
MNHCIESKTYNAEQQVTSSKKKIRDNYFRVQKVKGKNKNIDNEQNREKYRVCRKETEKIY